MSVTLRIHLGRLLAVGMSALATYAGAANLSNDSSMGNSCVQTSVNGTLGTIGSTCGSTGNQIQVNAAWTAASSFQSYASAYACNNFFVDYVPGQFMYSGAKDCSGATQPYYNAAHVQTTPTYAGWIQGLQYNDLKLYDSRYPNGYKLGATIAVNDVSTTGFARVTLVFNLLKENGDPDSAGDNIYVEFDAYDNANVVQCTQSGEVWAWDAALTCPRPERGGLVFERYRYFGGGVNNIPQGAWTTIEVDSNEVGETIGRYRPDLTQTALKLRQVYVAMELKGTPEAPAYAHIQTGMLALESK